MSHSKMKLNKRQREEFFNQHKQKMLNLYSTISYVVDVYNFVSEKTHNESVYGLKKVEDRDDICILYTLISYFYLDESVDLQKIHDKLYETEMEESHEHYFDMLKEEIKNNANKD